MTYSWSEHPTGNTSELEILVHDFLTQTPYEGVVSSASFQTVYNSALDVQQKFLKNIVNERFPILMESGSIVSVGISYHKSAIDSINEIKGDSVDYNLWNVYSRAYDTLNILLNELTVKVASEINGVSIPATTDTPTDSVDHVTDYFSNTISHRLIAELSGLGWRGKNGLIIHPEYSCAIRFSSVIADLPLEHGHSMNSLCGDCIACEEVCSFIRYRDQLPDYRENCRRYLTYLGQMGITAAVCGKCIKACFSQSLMKTQFNLR